MSGCASPPPIGPGHAYEPDKDEVRRWQVSREIAAKLESSGKLLQNPELEAYVQSVLERALGNNLSAYLPLKPYVRILDSPHVNAMCLPHGAIYVHSAILGRMRNEAQLAMLLGHEITHATHRHGHQEMEAYHAGSGTLNYLIVLSALGGSTVQSAVKSLGPLITRAAITGYSRDKEEEADRVGLALLAQAGYDSEEGPKMFQRMLDATDPKDRGWNFLYATHPKMKNRVRDCGRSLTKLPDALQGNVREVGRDSYLAHTAPLIYDEVERHIGKGKFDLAEDTVAFMAEARPHDLQPHVLRGDLCRARAAEGDDEAAFDAYEHSIEKDAHCAKAHRGLGLLWRKKKDQSRAAEHFRRYVELAPDAPDANYIRQYLAGVEGGQ